MTVKATLAAIKALSMVTARHTDGEYRVTFTVDYLMTREDCGRTDAIEIAENVAYYTNDADDALGTAKAMVQRERANGGHVFDSLDMG